MWGIELDEDNFACAVAALCVLLEFYRRFPFGNDSKVLESTLLEALGDGKQVVELSYWLRAQELDTIAYTPEARALARAWRRVVNNRPAPRLEIQWPNIAILDQPWLPEQLSRPAVRAASVYIRRNKPEVEVSWAWPVRVGFLADPASAKLHVELATTRWADKLARLTTVPTIGTECDILLLPFDLRGALLATLEAPERLKASCVVVLGGSSQGAENLGARILALRGETGAGCVAIARVPEEERRWWFTQLLEELSHDHPIDVALTTSLRTISAPPPLIAASSRLVEMTRVSMHAEALRRGLERLDPDHEITLTDETTRRLGLLQSLVSVRGVGARFEKSLLDFSYLSEAGDASTVADIVRALEAAPAAKLPPGLAAHRRIQVRVHDLRNPREPIEISRAMRAGALHAIDVRVGLDDIAWARLDEEFPEEKLPAGDAPRRLTVVLTEPRLAPDPKVATIVLPREGSSDVARFFVRAREGVSQMEARITILYENRVLQTALVQAPILEDPERAPEGSAVRLQPETFVTMDLGDLGGRRKFDAALILNHAGGEPQMTAIAGEYACLVSLGNVEEMVSKLVERLSAMAHADESYASLDDPKVGELFHFLASQGSLLFETLKEAMLPTLKETLLTAARIQVVAAKQGALLPIEFAYAPRAPDQSATLCAGAREALATGRCSASCPSGADKRQIVCPLGFWGLNRVIERQSAGALPLAGTGADFGIRVNGGPRKHLDILKSALFAASSRTDEESAGSTQGVRDALIGATRGHLETAVSWKEWIAGVKATAPSLLVLIVHTEKIKKDDMQALEIGQGSQLLLSEIYDEYVRADEKTAPVVLLVGCKTSIAEIDFQQFPVKFQRYGAALVLGTVATILGRHAGPVTARLVATLAELTAKHDVLFGDALLATKQKLVAEGKLMAMCLCAHGDAGWILGMSDRETK
jgi:hypothetical protein